MRSIIFDHAAGFYDATRGFAPGVAERIRDAIVSHTGTTRASRLLELGVGTGRIALPFMAAGYRFAGIDLAGPMLAALRQKLPDGARPWLAVADVTRLPFESASFDVVIAVHVLHLVEGWRQALQEARRVLRPGAWLVLAYEEWHDDVPAELRLMTPPRQTKDAWVAILRELGSERTGGQPGVRPTDPRVAEFLRDLGAVVEKVHLAEFEQPGTSARTVAAHYRDRIYSSDWSRPEDVHCEAVRRLEHWLATRCDDPDTPYANRGRFMALVAR